MYAGMQFSSTLNWYVLNRPAGVDVLAIPPLAWLAALLLVGCGQALNIGIFNAIGSSGVYYGSKLGHDIPWVEGFPFNVVRHPQYVGSVMTVWGLAALVWTQAPAGLGLLAAYWTVLYIITGWMESSL
jgi:methylene-fatty-acyl-phospholipid synthase